MTNRLSTTGQWAKRNSQITTIASVLTIAVSAIGFGASQWEGLLTDKELNRYDHGHAEALKDEASKQGGLPAKTRKTVAGHEDIIQRARAEQIQDRKNIRKSWWWMVGYAAADAEPCRQLKALASSWYRQQFTLELQNEPDYETAYTRALNSTWQERHSLARSVKCR